MTPDAYDCEPLASALERGGVEVAIDTGERLTNLPAGHALRGLCRVAWSDGDRDDLFAWLRLAGSSWAPSRAHDSEATLRGRNIADAQRAERDAAGGRSAAARPRADRAPGRHRSRGRPAGRGRRRRSRARTATSPVPAETRTGVTARRALAAASAAADELSSALPGADGRRRAGRARRRAGAPRRRPAARPRAHRPHRPGAARARARARALRPRGGRAAAARGRGGRRLGRAAAGAHARRAAGRPPASGGARPLPLRGRARARRRAARARAPARRDDDGLELAPSPFWDEVVRVLGDARHRARSTTPAHALDGHDERERLQAIAALARGDAPRPHWRAPARTAAARLQRIERALAAWRRPTRLRDPQVLARLAGQETYSVTELETFQTCSALWFVERQLQPARRRAAARRPHQRQRDAQRAAAVLQRGAIGAARPAAASRAPAGGLRPARPLHRRGDRDPGLRGRRRRLGGAAARAAAQPAHRRAQRGRAARRVRAAALRDLAAQSGVRVGDVSITGRIDRVDEREWVAEALIWDYKSGAVGALGAERARARSPAAAALHQRRGGAARPRRGRRALPVGQGRRGAARAPAGGRARGRGARGLRRARLRRSRSSSSSCSTRPPSARPSSRGA